MKTSKKFSDQRVRSYVHTMVFRKEYCEPTLVNIEWRELTQLQTVWRLYTTK